MEPSYTMTADVSDAAGNAVDQVTSSAFTYDVTAPTVSSAAMSDSALKSGETATLTITFSEAVTAFANADLTIPNGSLTAVSSADGGTTWTATYTPDADVEDTSNVISIATSYTDLAGNAGAAGQTANFEIDTLLPTITSITSDTNDGSYNQGDEINIIATFSEAVSLSGGNFVITLDSGGTVTITSITSSTTANGTYTVGAGQTSADLTASSIELSAGSLSDAAGNAMTNFTPAYNLAAGSVLVVDTTAPTVSSFTMSDTALKSGRKQLQ